MLTLTVKCVLPHTSRVLNFKINTTKPVVNCDFKAMVLKALHRRKSFVSLYEHKRFIVMYRNTPCVLVSSNFGNMHHCLDIDTNGLQLSNGQVA